MVTLRSDLGLDARSVSDRDAARPRRDLADADVARGSVAFG
jgi:hypothetical protein